MACGIAGLCLVLSACEEPPPRTFADFMEDPIARDGTIARCNADREATLHDIECANARRALSAIALRQEREKREILERESEQRLEEYRRRLDEADRIAREAAREVIEAEREAYERRWSEGAAQSAEDPGSDANVLVPGADVGLPAGAVSEPELPGDGLSLIDVPEGARTR